MKGMVAFYKLQDRCQLYCDVKMFCKNPNFLRTERAVVTFCDTDTEFLQSLRFKFVFVCGQTWMQTLIWLVGRQTSMSGFFCFFLPLFLYVVEEHSMVTVMPCLFPLSLQQLCFSKLKKPPLCRTAFSFEELLLSSFHLHYRFFLHD